MSLLARIIIFIVICLLALLVGISIRMNHLEDLTSNDNDVIDCDDGICPIPEEYKDE